MKSQIFRGVGTALITPFADGEIDLAAFDRLIERQLEASVDALIIGGTTAEAATLSDRERYTLFEEAKRVVNGRCRLIFGTGTNDTRGAVKHTKEAERIGCDAVLVVTPYYNKGTREGLVRHYKKIAASTDLPIILYNVPSRTGVNIDIESLVELCRVENIVGIKEASDSIDRLVSLATLSPDVALYSGNDSQLYTTLCLGGLGIISVVSNIYPKQMMDICKQFFAGNLSESKKMQNKLLPVINSLFLETNPAPLKYAMSGMGLCSAEMRLPMWLPSRVTRKRIDRAIALFEAECNES